MKMTRLSVGILAIVVMMSIVLPGFACNESQTNSYVVQMGIYENLVANYLKENPTNHVCYKVTPVYKGENKLPSGVQMEAYSVEDSGGLEFNVYCYNVQPGIELNYTNGDNALADVLYGNENALPFAIQNANDSTPDLLLEINKHLAILFEDQKNSGKYKTIMNEINDIAYAARSKVAYRESNSAQQYMELKEIQYKYYEVLRNYIPLLLSEESFFKSAFN